MSNPWFRLYSEFANDPKVQMLSEQNQRRLIMIFCIRCNGSVTLQDKHVTFQLRITEQEWSITKAEFIANGFIDSDNNILNWDKRQYVSDTSKDRVARHRALHKDVTVTTCNVTVTPPEQIQNRTDTEHKQQKYIPPISIELLAEWKVIRKKKKSGDITERVFKGIEREARLAGITSERAIEVCCEKGWASFDASWYNKIPAKQDSLKRTGDLLTGRIRNEDTITIDMD